VRRLRISVVEYLNTVPLVWGFTQGPLAGKYDLSFTVPSLCAEELRSGQADVAVIPAIEYQRMDDVVVLPGMCIAARDEVRSILVIAKKPIEQARRVALDRSSRSSAALVKLLCAGRWKIAPEFVETAPNVGAMLADADAALVIGDPALRLALRAEEGPRELLVQGYETLFLYDVAHEWKEMTGKPCVLAMWVARREAARPEVVADFLASREYGLARIAEIAAKAAVELELPAQELEKYLRENIQFSLDEENRLGLELYFRLCAEAGLTPRAMALEFADRPAAWAAGRKA